LINVCNFVTHNDCIAAKLTRRDPRMVERKKTGLAKARKRVSPINHFEYFRITYASNSTPGSNVEKGGELVGLLSLQSVHGYICGIKK
jgi:Ribosomal protein S9/S16